jgi:hypothetical protein
MSWNHMAQTLAELGEAAQDFESHHIRDEPPPFRSQPETVDVILLRNTSAH